MKIRFIYAILLLYICIEAYPQKQANNWYFGKYAGLDFNSGQPELISNDMFTALGSCSAISDKYGNFLFTTNGEQIWNSEKRVMLNGSAINGDKRSGQGSLILQKPGSVNLYYVFTTTFADGNLGDFGLYYSVVDMNLDSGLGRVTDEKNILLFEAWDAAEKIVACKHENGEDIWVITRKFHEDGFAAFLLTSEGLNTNAIFSPAIDRPYNKVWAI